MRYTPHFRIKKRDELYSRESNAAHKAGRGKQPICPHCDLPVTPGQLWDEVHVGTPRAFGGKSTAVGHRKCNQLDNNQVVTPLAAKANEVRKKHLGIKGPGLGRHAMQGGRRSDVKRKITGEVVERKSQTHQHREFMAKRYPFLEAQP